MDATRRDWNAPDAKRLERPGREATRQDIT